MEPNEPVVRSREIEEFTNRYFIHPISTWLTPILARFGISPNTVSFTGMLFGILAGAAYNHYHNPYWVFAGFLLMIAWHVMDGADGQLARLTNSQSRLGKIIDGICDYVTFIAVYVGLGIALEKNSGLYVWPLIFTAGVCHALQAAAYEVQQQEYNFWGYQRKSAELPKLSELTATQSPSSYLQWIVDRLYIIYVRMQYWVAGMTMDFRYKLAAELKRQSNLAETIRERYRETFAPSVRSWTLLSANYRTIAIFICSIAHVPLLYFVLEIVGFSLIMVILILRQRVLCRRFLEGLRV